MPVNGNTTPLGSGEIGALHFQDYTANEIGVNISRYNYRKTINTDKELLDFRRIVYKMVSGWAREDKIAQITEYGDADFLKKYGNHPSDEQLSRILTETIIIHLDPADLRRLRALMIKKQDNLKANINNIESKRRLESKKLKKYLTTNTFNENYQQMKDKVSNRQVKKAIKSVIAVPRKVTRQFPILRKEIIDVLRECFTNVDLANYAYRLGVEFEPGDSFKVISTRIANKVCLFVALVLGLIKEGYGNAVTDIEPYKEILQYTSYSYVVGVTGTDRDNWQKLRKRARDTKRLMIEINKTKGRRTKLDLIDRVSLTKKFRKDAKARRKFESDPNNKGRSYISNYFSTDQSGIDEITRLKRQILENIHTIDLLQALAGRLGVKYNEHTDEATLRSKIYLALDPFLKRRRKLFNKNENLKRAGKNNSVILSQYDVYKDIIPAGGSLPTESNSIPIVWFNADGELLKIQATRYAAVPVYVVGSKSDDDKVVDDTGTTSTDVADIRKKTLFQRFKDLFKKNKQPVDEQEQTRAGIGKNADLTDAVNSATKATFTPGKNRVIFTKTIQQNIDEMSKRGYTPMSAIFKSKNTDNGIGKSYNLKNEDLEWALSQKPVYKFAKGGVTYSDMFITGDADHKNIFSGGAKPELVQTFSESPVVSKITPIKKFAKGGVSTSASHSTYSVDYLAAKAQIANMMINAGKSISSTFLDSDAQLTASSLKSAFSATRSGTPSKNAKAIIGSINQLNTTVRDQLIDLQLGLGAGFQLAAPMGVGAGTFAGLLATGIKNKALAVAGDVAGTAASTLFNTISAATGGKIYRAAAGASVTSNNGTNKVITGDAAGHNIFRGGAKPELVESSSDITVTPLNKTGDENRSKIDRLSSDDRKNALATAISSHAIKFSYRLPDGASEISSAGEAIKVFNVKPGIDDIVSVNGTETSLVDILAGIQTQLSALISTATSGNAILSEVALNSSNTTTSNTTTAINLNPFAGGFPSSMNTILGGG